MLHCSAPVIFGNSLAALSDKRGFPRLDADHSCKVCGGTRVASGMKEGEQVYRHPVRPLRVHEPKAADPATWNEGSAA